jgi:hypothetical protein
LQLQEGLAASRATGAELYRPYFLYLLAEAWRETGRLDDELSALTEALAAANEPENRNYEAETHRLKGGLLLKRQAERRGAERTSPQKAARAHLTELREAKSAHLEKRTLGSCSLRFFQPKDQQQRR